MKTTNKELIERLSKQDPNATIFAVIWDKYDLMPDLPEDQDWTEAQVEKVFGNFEIGERSWDSIGDDESAARESLEEFRCETCYDHDLRTIQIGTMRQCPPCGEEEEVI